MEIEEREIEEYEGRQADRQTEIKKELNRWCTRSTEKI